MSGVALVLVGFGVGDLSDVAWVRDLGWFGL